MQQRDVNGFEGVGKFKACILYGLLDGPHPS
jgi:hypothetical protein